MFKIVRRSNSTNDTLAAEILEGTIVRSGAWYNGFKAGAITEGLSPVAINRVTDKFDHLNLYNCRATKHYLMLNTIVTTFGLVHNPFFADKKNYFYGSKRYSIHDWQKSRGPCKVQFVIDTETNTKNVKVSEIEYENYDLF